MNRNFLQGDTRHQGPCHAIGWGVITKPKAVGGLGIKNIIHNK